jgi:PAS domain S-box-containing protein
LFRLGNSIDSLLMIIHDFGNHSSQFQKEEAAANILKGFEDFTLDDTGLIISSNLEAVNVTGYEEWEVIGKKISIFYTEQEIQEGRVEADLNKAREGKKLNYSSWKVKKRKVNFWARISIKCIHDPESETVRYKVILKDQTYRLISNNKMLRLKNEYRSLFDNPFIGIFKFRSIDFKILLLNNKANQILENRKLKKFSELFESRVEFQWLLEKLIRNKKACGFEFQLNGQRDQWARIDCQFFEDEGFVEGVITDITESKKQLLQLERLNSDLDNFIYRASHDLRSPLTTLLGLINLAEVDNETDSNVYHKMMRDRITHLDNLLADLAAITYNNKEALVLETINFKEIIQQLRTEFIHKASINVSMHADEDIAIYSDPQRILTILRNIINHSLNHFNPVFQSHHIVISVVVDSAKAVIKLKDNGRGIKDDQLLRMFGIFYKITNEVNETGLSLYMTKLFVDKLNGEIHVKSQIGSGTEFDIILPNMKLEKTYPCSVNF